MQEATALRTVLNAGCGGSHAPPEIFDPAEWRELTLDADPAVGAEIVADVREIPLADGSVGGVYTSHTIEHLPERDVIRALREFHRILEPGGALLIRVPDLGVVARAILDGGLTEPLYDSPAGPIRPLDMLYGYQRMAQDNPLMRHCMGFTAKSLSSLLAYTGFKGQVHEMHELYELVANAHKPPEA